MIEPFLSLREVGCHPGSDLFWPEVRRQLIQHLAERPSELARIGEAHVRLDLERTHDGRGQLGAHLDAPHVHARERQLLGPRDRLARAPPASSSGAL